MALRRIFMAGLLGCTMLAGCNGSDDKADNTTSQGTYDQLRAEIGQLRDSLGKKDEDNQQTFAALKTALAQLQALGLGGLKAEIADLQARMSAMEAGQKELAALSAHLDKIDAALNALDAKTLSTEDRTRLGALHTDFAALKADYDAAVKLAGEPASTTTLTKLLEGLGSGKADKTLIDNLQKTLNELTQGFDKAKLGTEKSAEDIGKRIAELEAAIEKLTPRVDIALTQFVNPMIGTGQVPKPDVPGSTEDLLGGFVNPGAKVPFGMVSWGPETDTISGTWSPRGYHYDTSSIHGFPMINLNGVGCPTQAPFMVQPMAKASDGYASFSHDKETVHPGYYRVEFDNGVLTELTATARTGLGRFTFPKDKGALLKFNMDSATVDVTARTISATTNRRRLLQQ